METITCWTRMLWRLESSISEVFWLVAFLFVGAIGIVSRARTTVRAAVGSLVDLPNRQKEETKALQNLQIEILCVFIDDKVVIVEKSGGIYFPDPWIFLHFCPWLNH